MGKKRNQANKEKQAVAAAVTPPPSSSSSSSDQASIDPPTLAPPSSPPSAPPAAEVAADEPGSSSDDEAPLITAAATDTATAAATPSTPSASAPLDDHPSPPVSSSSSSTSPPASTPAHASAAPASAEREPLIAHMPAPVHPQPFAERPLHPAIVVPTRGAADAPTPIRKRTTPTSAATAPSTVPVASLTANAASRRAPSSSTAPAKNQLQLAAWLIALSSFLWGYGVAVLNVCIVPDAVGSLLVDINLTTEEQETATALVLVGALLSALLSGGLGERIGLKTAILLNNLFFIVGGVACALAVSKRAIFLGRFSIGLGCGVVTNTAPILLNEISPAAMRGRITSYHQLLLTIGMLMTGIFGFLVVEDVPSGWRYLNGFMVVPSAVQIVMLAWIPESPFWLMKYKGKDHSRRVLMRLRDAHNRDAIEAELSDIALTMETNEVVRSAEWSDLWQYKSVLTLGTIMVFLQAMTGINTVMLYSAKIFHFAGVTNPFLATVVVGVTNVSITVLSVSLVDSQGRRPLLLRGTLLMIGSLLVLSASLLFLNGSPKWQAALAVGAVLLFVAGFAVGLGAVVWVVLADITPVEIRSRAFSFFMGTSYVCNILIAVYTLSAITFLGRGPNPEKDGIAKLYLILAGVAAVAYVFIYYRLPETTKAAIQAARVGSPSSEERSALLLPHDEQEDYDRNTTEL